MPYLTSFERKAIQRGHDEGLQQGRQEGLQQGLQQGLQKSIVTLLIFRFGALPETITATITAIRSTEQLEQLMASALKSESLEAFIAQMPNT